jgi:hypothetical protein
MYSSVTYVVWQTKEMCATSLDVVQDKSWTPDELDVQDKSWISDEIDVQDKFWTQDEIDDKY